MINKLDDYFHEIGIDKNADFDCLTHSQKEKAKILTLDEMDKETKTHLIEALLDDAVLYHFYTGEMAEQNFKYAVDAALQSALEDRLNQYIDKSE